MATNKPKGDGRRHGSIKNRTQVYNPRTHLWTKIGKDKKFMDGKVDGKPFKGVRKIK
jgi:hypothetical protein